MLTTRLLESAVEHAGDPGIRPRHWRWGACRLAMRLAVTGLLASRGLPEGRLRAAVRPLCSTRRGWTDWQRAATEIGRVTGDPLMRTAATCGEPPELRALLRLEQSWLRSADGLEPPELPDTAADPAPLLGDLYQELQEPGRRTASRGLRKHSGSFYTGADLAGPTVARTLRPMLDGAAPDRIRALRICDPAVGSGGFLVAVLRQVTDHIEGSTGMPRSEVARRSLLCDLVTSSLHGVDRDPTAVDLARWSLWFEIGDTGTCPTRLAPNLRVGDALLGIRPGDAVTDRAAADRWVTEGWWSADPTTPETGPDDRAHIAALHRRFFHWQLEFPNVFRRGGFDAVIGNPPWETLQPSSKEFFADLDPEYGNHGRQQALRRQIACFRRDPASELDWHTQRVEAAQFARYAKRRFELQGPGKLYTYRLFLEQSLAILRPGGRLGAIVPSGLYSDLGSAPLRDQLLDRCCWEWLFCFENRAGLFDIDSRYRFGPIIVQKGGRTERLKTAFLRTDPGEWQRRDPPSIPYSVEQIERLSPRHRALLDVRSDRDLDILDRMHACGSPFLTETDGDLVFAQGDFNMTSDSHLFRECREVEAEGYAPDPYDRWIASGSDTRHSVDRTCGFLPLYQGAMLYDMVPWAAVHDGGSGHRTRWRRSPSATSRPRPQYLIDSSVYAALPARSRNPQLVLRALSNSTNERTAVPGLIPDLPCGNSLVILRPRQPDLLRTLFGAGVMSTLIFDWSLRQRMAGTNLNRFVLADTVWPDAPREVAIRIALLAARLGLITPRAAPTWLELQRLGWLPTGSSWLGLLALTDLHRLDLQCTLDALVAALFGLGMEDLRWMFRDCDHPRDVLRDRTFTRTLDPKGFWRVHNERPSPERRPAMTMTAFADLQQHITARNGDRARGMIDFCEQRDGLAVPGGARARLLPWQACVSPIESWRLCAGHAERLRGRSRGDGKASRTAVS